MVDLLVEAGLVRSKGEARRTITEGGAYLIAGSWLVLRRGKKNPRRRGDALSR